MKKIGIICGGFSSEFEISIKSAETILTHLPKGYQGIKIIISKDYWKASIEDKEGTFDLNSGLINLEDGSSLTLDAALVYIHGNPGENGKIQAVLDLLGIPYANANMLASALSFDKWYCNQFLGSFGIPVAKSVFLRNCEPINKEEIIASLGLPLFIKPTDSGSSYGITKVKSEEVFDQAITTAFKEGDTIVIESFLDGIEVTCGVYRSSQGTTALPLTEIVSENEFFDYEAKYQGKSNEITPARITSSQTTLIQEQAKKIYTLLGLRSIARIDFMLVEDTPYVIEVNTTPGFSAESIVPKMLKEAGISISTFWETIFERELP